jgi:hypothetical protein
MTLVGERRLPDEPLPQMPSMTTGSSPPIGTTISPHNAAWKAGVLGTINVLAMTLAARMILLIGVSGAIWLTYLALASPDPYRLAVLGVYSVVVVVPLTWLAARGR